MKPIIANAYQGSIVLKQKPGKKIKVYHQTYEGDLVKVSRRKFIWRLFEAENGTAKSVRLSGFGAAEYARRLLRGAPASRQEGYARRVADAGMLTGEIACKILLAGKVTNEKAVAILFEAVTENRKLEIVLMGNGPSTARQETYATMTTKDEIHAYAKLLMEKAKSMKPQAQESLAAAIHAAVHFTPYSWDGKLLKSALHGLPKKEEIEANDALCKEAKEWMLDLAKLPGHVSKVITGRAEMKKRMTLELQAEHGKCGQRCENARKLLEDMGLEFQIKEIMIRNETPENMKLLYYSGFLDDETREKLEILKMKNNVQPTAESLKFRHGTDAPYPILKITLPGKGPVVLENFNEQAWRQRLQEIISGK